MPHVTTGETVTYYERRPGQGPAVVFVHGYCCESGDWKAQLDRLGERWETVALDLPGHGRSTIGSLGWTVEAFAVALSSVLDRVEADDVVLVGHSMGCRVVLETCHTRSDRVRAVVLVDGSWVGPGDAEEARHAAAKRIAEFGAQAWIVDSFERMFLDGSDTSLRARLVARSATARPEAAAELLPSMFAWDAGRMAEVLRSLRIPMLALQSTDLDAQLRRVALSEGDSTRWLGLLETQVCDLTLEIVPCRSHFPMLERPNEVSDLLVRFVDRLS